MYVLWCVCMCDTPLLPLPVHSRSAHLLTQHSANVKFLHFQLMCSLERLTKWYDSSACVCACACMCTSVYIVECVYHCAMYMHVCLLMCVHKECRIEMDAASSQFPPISFLVPSRSAKWLLVHLWAAGKQKHHRKVSTKEEEEAHAKQLQAVLESFQRSMQANSRYTPSMQCVPYVHAWSM